MPASVANRLAARRAARASAKTANRPPTRPTQAEQRERVNPLLKNGGAPTISLKKAGNPTPRAFLRQKFRMLTKAQDSGLLDSPEGRRELTKYEPFLFALLYMPQYFVLKPNNPANQSDPYGGITLCQFHVDVLIAIEEWAVASTATRQDRDAWVAPRESGKSSLLITVGPLWAAAHGHQRFIAAFSDSDDQVQKHLAKFHEQIDNNRALKEDFPDLCSPAKRSNGNSVNDNKNEYTARSGFTFSAHTIDGKTLGMVNFENARPTLIILDDIEPSEDKYSQAQKHKGVIRLTGKILYLNEHARVVMVGTVTMAGSIMHDVVNSVLTPGHIPDAPTPRNPHCYGSLVADWVREQNFRAHYYPALFIDPSNGRLTSLWPEKWPVTELAPRLGTNDFMKNMQNNPVGDGDYWEQSDIHYGTLANTTVTMLSIDPAVTASATSDYTGLAVIRYQPANPDLSREDVRARQSKPAPPPTPTRTREEIALQWAARRGRTLPPNPTRQQRAELIADLLGLIPADHPELAANSLADGSGPDPDNPSAQAPRTNAEDELLPSHLSRCEIAWANRVKMRPNRLRLYVLSILEQFPEISIIYIETNQGHDFVSEPFEELPVKVIVKVQSEPKDTRIARMAQYYKSLVPRVVHGEHFIPLEEEMLAYPQTANDDTIDAASTGCHYFLYKDPKIAKKRRPPPSAIQRPYLQAANIHAQAWRAA